MVTSLDRRLGVLEGALREERSGKPRLFLFVFPEPDAERDTGLSSQHPLDQVLIVYTGVPRALTAKQR